MEKLIETIERLLKEKESKHIEPCIITWVELAKSKTTEKERLSFSLSLLSHIHLSI